MLTPEQWQEVERQTSKIYSQLELEIIEEIATRIANTNIMNTVAYNDAMILQEMGVLYQDIINLVAKNNDTSVSQIQEIFETAGVKSINFDDSIYKEAGLSPISIKQSKSMLQVLQASAIKTNVNLSNLMLTTANTSQTAFYNSMNKAYLEVITGVKSYSSAILDAIEDVSKNNILVEYPSGYKTSIENACRMNIVTSVNQTCGKLQEIRAEEMDWDLMELTAHPGARPEHTVWQGQIVSRSGQKGYLSYSDIGYGEVTGFKGVNCRHDWYPFYEGSTRTYSNAELQELKNRTVTYNGKEMTVYEANQLQRKMERQIRQDKKELAGLQAGIQNSKDNKTIEKAKSKFANKTLYYNEHKSILNDFLEQIKNVKDEGRLFVYNKYSSQLVSQVTKLANEFNKSDIVGSVVNNVKITKIGEHIISQCYSREIKVENIRDTLQNPVKFGIIRNDDSQQIKGETCTVVINTKNGNLITAYPKKTERKKENDNK